MNEFIKDATGVEISPKTAAAMFKRKSAFQVGEGITAENLFLNICGVRDFWVFPKPAGQNRQWVAISEEYPCGGSYPLRWNYCIVEHQSDGMKVIKNTGGDVKLDRSQTLRSLCNPLGNDAYVAPQERTWGIRRAKRTAITNQYSVHAQHQPA